MRIDIDTENQTLTFNGVKIGFQWLHAMTDPDPNMLHKFERRGNNVKVTSHLSLTEFLPGGAIQ